MQPASEASAGASMRRVAGSKLEMMRHGLGQTILFLHPEAGIDFAAPVFSHLGKTNEIIVPSHPGFGESELQPGMSTVDDLAYFYLDFIAELGLRDVILAGVSFGAWIAAEMAIKSTARLSHLIMADAVGIKVSARGERDIADMFALTEPQFAALAYHDPAAARRDLAALPDSMLRGIARNRESAARFGWNPYMHDPKLKGRLHRIDIPTLFLWGESDRIVTPDYGRAYCAAIPGARFETIAQAGHAPHLEQPAAFAERLLGFTGGGSASHASILSQELA